MAYNPDNLSALAYANGFTLWHYRTNDVRTEIDTTGYFNGAVTMMRAGDFILANTEIDGAVAHGIFVVLSNDGTDVNIADLNLLGVLDDD